MPIHCHARGRARSPRGQVGPRASRRVVAATYSQPFAEIYDAALSDAAFPAILAGFAWARRRFGLNLRSGTSCAIADVGCGTGRFLEFLCGENATLYGVDLSRPMLEKTTARLPRKRARLLQMDLRTLALPERVDLITCWFATLNYLRDACDLFRTFRRFALNLKPGGWFVFDFIPWDIRNGPIQSATQSVSGRGERSIWRLHSDPQTGSSLARIKFASTFEHPAFEERHCQKWFARRVVSECLLRAGFKPLAMRPMGEGGPSPWLLVVARI